jgi:hypothetical protein
MITRTYAYFGKTHEDTNFSGCIKVKSWFSNSKAIYELLLSEYPDDFHIINITRI